ncbi:MAG: hypothetical protein M3256_16300, partial [Actinomycetota bacterium]|nr:hypothetical protein [Actinomycetota bacterium]
MAWLLAAIAGIPVVIVTCWALIDGYTFAYMPFMAARLAWPYALAPLIAGFLVSLWPSRASRAWALGICALCALASVLAILQILWEIPGARDDIFGDGSARVAFVSYFVAGVIALTYL